MVDRCSLMMSTIRLATCGQTELRSASPAALPVTRSAPLSSRRIAPISLKSSIGDSTWTTISLSIGGAITATDSGSPART